MIKLKKFLSLFMDELRDTATEEIMQSIQDLNVQPSSVPPLPGEVVADEFQHCVEVASERSPDAGGAQDSIRHRKVSRGIYLVGVVAIGVLCAALLVMALTDSVQSHFFKHQDGVVASDSSCKDDEKTDDNTSESEGNLCFAELRRRSAEAIRVQEPLRRQRLRACAAPCSDEIQLLVEEAYGAAKRHAERRALEWNDCSGSGSGISLIEIQEELCEDVVAFIERICNRQLEATARTRDTEHGELKDDTYRDRPSSESETAHGYFVSLIARLLPDMPYAEVNRCVNEVLRPARMTKHFDYYAHEDRLSLHLMMGVFPYGTVQCWTAPAHARSLIAEQKREIRLLEPRARRGERQSLERILDLLVFNPKSFFAADPALALEIYESAKKANPNLRLKQEPQIQLTLFLSASTPMAWGDRRVYLDEDKINLDLWGDGEPGYHLSLAWHYAHDPAFRWDIFQCILVRSGGGLDNLLPTLRRAYLYAQEHSGMGREGDLTFINGDQDIDFDSPREIRRYLAYHERKRLEGCRYPAIYEQGVRFIALQNTNEEVFSNLNSPLDRAHQENALRQDMAIDLALVGEEMLTPIPSDARQIREEYRQLCDEVGALLVSKTSDKPPTAAAFQATQKAWGAYCRSFENAIPYNELVPTDDWRVWLLEKRIQQLRRLKHRMLAHL